MEIYTPLHLAIHTGDLSWAKRNGIQIWPNTNMICFLLSFQIDFRWGTEFFPSELTLNMETIYPIVFCKSWHSWGHFTHKYPTFKTKSGLQSKWYGCINGITERWNLWFVFILVFVFEKLLHNAEFRLLKEFVLFPWEHGVAWWLLWIERVKSMRACTESNCSKTCLEQSPAFHAFHD